MAAQSPKNDEENRTHPPTYRAICGLRRATIRRKTCVRQQISIRDSGQPFSGVTKYKANEVSLPLLPLLGDFLTRANPDSI
jgi:hypothetical protein